jgi:biopolymer transport protein ExbD
VSIDTEGTLRFGPDLKPVTLDRLREQLIDGVTKNPELRLAIAADKAAPWGQVVKVMDVAKEAKVKTGGVNAFMRESGK